MRAYIIRRLLLVIPTLLGLTIVTFLMLRFIPGDIIDMMMLEAESTGTMDRVTLERTMGLDVPMHIEYFRWLGVAPDTDGDFSGVLQGDLGASLWTKAPVTQAIAERLPVSIELAIFGFLIMMIVALPVGIYSALQQDSPGDYVSRGFATTLVALPNFWVGLMIILLASLWFGMSPPLRIIPFARDPIGHLAQFIPPAVAMAMGSSGLIMRMMRSMMLEVLRQDYIRTAWAKGLPERVVIFRHALRNALIPVVTLAGIAAPAIVGGTVVMERVFNLPGMGRLLVLAITDRDYPIVSGALLIYGVVLVISNLLVDLSYCYLDPRIRYK